MEFHRKNTRLKIAEYNNVGAYFLTICTRERKCLLSEIVGTGVPDGPSVKLKFYGEIAEKYLTQLNAFYDNISIDSYVIMPNHIHMILFIHDAHVLKAQDSEIDQHIIGHGATMQNSIISKFVSTFKRFCNKDIGENIWQYRSYDHIIRNQRDYDEHIRYINENPIRWENDRFYGLKFE